MIINLENTKNINKLNNYDIVIAGSGIAALSFCDIFFNTNIKILIVEKGNLNHSASYEYNNKSFATGDFNIDFENERKIGFFGTAGLWSLSGKGGHFFKFDELDFAKDNLWSITYEEINSYYLESLNFLEIKNKFTYIDKLEKHFNKSSFFFKLNSHFNLKYGSSWLAKGKRFSRFIKKYKEKIQNSKNIDLLAQTELIKINLNKYSNSVNSININNNDKIYNLNTSYFILACGCFGNNYHLLNCEIENKINLFTTGKYISFHPSILIGTLEGSNMSIKGLNINNVLTQLKPLNCEYLKKLNYSINLNPQYQKSIVAKNLNNQIVDIKKLFNNQNYITLILKVLISIINLKLIRYILIKIKNKFYKKLLKIDVSISFEHLPDKGNLIQIDGKSLNITSFLNEKNLKLLSNIMKKNVSIFENNFLNFYKKKINLTDIKFETNNHHHGGTLIGSNNYSKNPLNNDLRHKKIKNLFVLGSSVFPSSSVYNPTLTIIALAIRLSKKIRNLVK